MFATTIIHFGDAYASIASHVYREATGIFPIVIGVLVVGGIAGLVGVAHNVRDSTMAERQ